MSKVWKFYKNQEGFVKCLAACCFLFSFSGCGEISNQISATFKHVQDFKRSEIISNSPAVADGQSELLVVIQLMNTDGSSVKLFKPTYEVISGAGVTAQECTTSNDNGVSTCVLKANQAGIKRVSVTNINIELQADVVFSAPIASKSLFGLISANKVQNQGNFSLSGSIGNQEPGLPRTNGVFKLYGGVQGEAFSR
jgi:hypothetical protein